MNKSKKKTDRHKSGFMVRLPEEIRQQVNQLRKKTRRSITEEIKVAVEGHLKGHGLWPPANMST